ELKCYLQGTVTQGRSLWEQLRQPNNSVVLEELAKNPDIKSRHLDNSVLQAVIIDGKYEGYIGKQQRLVASLQSLENKKIPPDLDVNKIAHLRAEAKEKLAAFRPGTLGQASRISGITPADITVIQIHLKKYYK
ncbi:MAG: tRNA uridine-5-carboxymethylaminomethyl(34) synthesis enzyme MnmG, partial [Planctomycetota bacterium]